MPLNHGSKYSELPDRQYTLIGKIIVEFSNIDMLLSRLLTRLLFSPDFLGRSFTDQLMVSKTIKAIKQALEVHKYRYGNRFISVDKAQDITNLLGSVQKVQELRNKFAHHVLQRHTDDKIFGTKLSGKPPGEDGHTHDHFIMDEESLKMLYKNAHGVVSALILITDTIREVDEAFILKELLRLEAIDPLR